MRDQSIKARLEAALDVAQYTGEAYAALSHDFACHYDGSECHLGDSDNEKRKALCVPDRENLDMVALAKEHVDAGDHDIDSLKRAWAQRMMMS